MIGFDLAYLGKITRKRTLGAAGQGALAATGAGAGAFVGGLGMTMTSAGTGTAAFVGSSSTGASGQSMGLLMALVYP